MQNKFTDPVQQVGHKHSTLSGKYVMQSDVLSRTNEDGTIILMKKYNNKIFFKLDGLAAQVWQDLSTGRSLEDVMKTILAEYEISEETLERDLSLLLKALLNRDLIRPEDETYSDPIEFTRQWPKSLPFLKEKILSYFKRQGIRTDNVWFTDIEMAFPGRLLSKTDIQVVFFGSFFERLFESGNWPLKNYTFWCLSQRVRKVLVEMLKLPPNSVKQIPRYEILPLHPTPKKIDLLKDLRLLYAGRISAQKNIEFFLAFAHAFQEELAVQVEIFLLGEWDNSIPKGKGRASINTYQKTIELFMKELGEFKRKPVFLHNLESGEWQQYLVENSLVASFSTFMCEDYGLALAEAQGEGVPLIVSDWGGHADIQGENVFFVSKCEIEEGLGEPQLIREKGRMAALKFLRQERSSKHIPAIEDFEFQSVTLNELHELRLKVLQEYGFELAMIGQDRTNLIANAGRGVKFFTQFEQIFSGET